MQALGSRGFLVYGLRLTTPTKLIYANFYLTEEAALRDMENIMDHEAPGWEFDASDRYVVDVGGCIYAYSLMELGPSKLISSPVLIDYQPPLVQDAVPMSSPRVRAPDV